MGEHSAMPRSNPRMMPMMGMGAMPMLGMVKANEPGAKRPPVSRIIFNKYDKDGSEFIDAAEFKFMVMDLGHQLSEEQEKFAILKIDKSGAGKISYDDFLAWWKEFDDGEQKWAALELDDEQLLQLSMLLTEFQAFDANDDGVIDRAEFTEMYESLKAGGVEKPLETVLAELDINHDDKIVFNEYVEWLKKNSDARIEMACAAHAAATARANADVMDTGIEEGAAPDEVCPPKVVVVEEEA